jgi:hypothetical protein
MKIKKIILLLTLSFIVLPIAIQSQQIENDIKKISLKLKKDKTYLNLKYLTTQLDSSIIPTLQDVPRTNGRKPYSFSSGNNIQYQIVFLNRGIELDSIYLMYINEIRLNTLSGKSFFVDESIKDDTTEVLSFNDLYRLKLEKSDKYTTLLQLINNYVEESEGDVLPSLLQINPDSKNKSYMGMSSHNNRDYFNFQRINSPHYIPSEKKKKTSVRNSKSLEKKFRLDASFSRITFSLKALDYSIGSTGFEISSVEPILNLLPYESSTILIGFRSIFRISVEKKIEDATFIDAKLMARMNTRNSTLYNNLPFVMGDNAKLNINNGIGGEINLTRVFGLPYITIKGYVSNTKFEKPTYFVKTSASTKDAYFSSSQAEATFSFYWNANTQLTNRFRFDFGVGYFNIWKNSYNANEEITYSDAESNVNIVPVFGLHYTFVPDGTPLLGMNLRVFDTIISAGGWIKIFEFAPENVLRLEATTILEPITRSLKPWESSDGIFFQFRYRYGL